MERRPTYPQRFCKDVLEKKPDIVFINFGMNDHLLSKEGRRYTQISDFEKNICCFIDELEKIGARAVLVTPNYFLEGNESEYYYSRHNEKDYEKYGGSGIVNGKVKAIAGKMHGKNQYLELEIPAFSTMYFYKKASKSKSNTKI